MSAFACPNSETLEIGPDNPWPVVRMVNLFGLVDKLGPDTTSVDPEYSIRREVLSADKFGMLPPGDNVEVVFRDGGRAEIVLGLASVKDKLLLHRKVVALRRDRKMDDLLGLLGPDRDDTLGFRDIGLRGHYASTMSERIANNPDDLLSSHLHLAMLCLTRYFDAGRHTDSSGSVPTNIIAVERQRAVQEQYEKKIGKRPVDFLIGQSLQVNPSLSP